jgi:curved DNA-binding protein CbpA
MNYYQVLGVESSATESEIKKAFRRLAVMYHPDKNPDPQAENIFKVVNEAYDVLSDPVARRRYDQALLGVVDNPVQTTYRHRDPAYRPARPRQYRPTESQRIREAMTRFLPFAKACSIFCFVLCSALMIDYALPSRITQEEVTMITTVRTYSRNSSTTWWVIHTSGGVKAFLPYIESDHFKGGEVIEVATSRFLKVPFHIRAGSHSVKIGKTIYGNFIFAPIALLVISGIGVIVRNNIDYGFNFGVTSFVILIFMIFILLTL